MDIGVHSQGVEREETIQDRGVEKLGAPEESTPMDYIAQVV